MEANISQDIDKVKDVRNLLNELKSAWEEIVTKNSVETVGKTAPGVNIAG